MHKNWEFKAIFSYCKFSKFRLHKTLSQKIIVKNKSKYIYIYSFPQCFCLILIESSRESLMGEKFSRHTIPGGEATGAV